MSSDKKDLTLAELLDTPFVRCDHCSNVYTSPVLLPCLHTFCQQCIIQITVQENAATLQQKESGQCLKQKRPKSASSDQRDEGKTPRPIISDGNDLTDGGRTPDESFTVHCPTCRSKISFDGAIYENTCINEDADGENDKDTIRVKDMVIPAAKFQLMTNAVQRNLPINYFIDSLTRLYRHKTDAGRECAYCKTEDVIADATGLCLQCGDDVCEACANAHRKTRVTRDHRVIAYSAIQQGLFDHDIRAAVTLNCDRHTDSFITHFCNNCSKVTCKKCVSKQHFGHATINLKDASAKLVPEISNVQQGLSRRIPDLSNYINFLSDQLNSLKQRCDKTVGEINTQAEFIHRKVDEWRTKAISTLETQTTKERKEIEGKMDDMKTSKRAMEKSAHFLLNLSNLGKVDEKMALYAPVMRRYHQLLQSRPKAMTSRLGISFTPGPTTDQNIRMLLGKLTLKRDALGNEDTPKSRLPMSSLMPAVKSPPELVKSWTIYEPTPATCHDNKAKAKTSSLCTFCYISGIDIKGNMLAAVDRENAKVVVIDMTNKNVLKEVTGTGDNKLHKPFDVAFLPSGAMAITDPEVSSVKVFDWTGKFIFNFESNTAVTSGKQKVGKKQQSTGLTHPRGITLNKKGEVVVLDGHLRQCTIHDSSTGKLLRVVTPYRDLARQSNDEENVTDSFDDADKTINSENEPLHTSGEKNLSPMPVLVDPFYVAITPHDNLVITDAASPNVKILGQDGLVLEESMDYGTHMDESLHPSGVCVDKSGYILLADTYNSRIHLGLPNGQFSDILLQAQQKADLSHPISMCLDNDGHLVVVQVEGKVCVYKYL